MCLASPAIVKRSITYSELDAGVRNALKFLVFSRERLFKSVSLKIFCYVTIIIIDKLEKGCYARWNKATESKIKIWRTKNWNVGFVARSWRRAADRIKSILRLSVRSVEGRISFKKTVLTQSHKERRGKKWTNKRLTNFS